MYRGHEFMLEISAHYWRAMGNGKFVGHLFRPFGTSFVAGGVSTYLYALFPLLFLSRKFMRSTLALLPVIFVVLFLCQVRSAMVKAALFLVLLLLLQLVLRQIRLKSFFQLIIFIGFISSAFFYILSNYAMPNYKVDLTESYSRLNRITESGQRLGPSSFYGLLAHRILKTPLGFGPGLTGAAASIGMESFLENKLVHEDDVWSYDNFYLSLFTDFGVLAIFYICLLIGVPVIGLASFWRHRGKFNVESGHRITVALSASFVLLIGNWGAIGLPYNPESFVFWYWISILTVGISKENI